MLFPVRWISLPGAVLGWVLFSVFRLARRTTLKNLAIALADRTEAERLRIAASCYRFFGGVILEYLSLPRIPPRRMSEFVTLEGMDVLRAALAEGRGAMVMGGHLGNWEMVAPTLAASGLPISIYVGGQRNFMVDRAMNAIRAARGSRIIGKGNPRGLVRALKERDAIAIIADHHEPAQRYFVAYFGQPVSAAPGPAQLLLRSGAAMLMTNCIREGRFRYRAQFVRLPLPPPTGDEERDILAITQVYFSALEEAVRRHPEQYFWMHRHFRDIGASARLTDGNRAFLAERGIALPLGAAVNP